MQPRQLAKAAAQPRSPRRSNAATTSAPGTGIANSLGRPPKTSDFIGSGTRFFTLLFNWVKLIPSILLSYPLPFITVVALLSLIPEFLGLKKDFASIEILNRYGQCVFTALAQPTSVAFFAWLQGRNGHGTLQTNVVQLLSQTPFNTDETAVATGPFQLTPEGLLQRRPDGSVLMNTTTAARDACRSFMPNVPTIENAARFVNSRWNDNIYTALMLFTALLVIYLVGGDFVLRDLIRDVATVASTLILGVFNILARILSAVFVTPYNILKTVCCNRRSRPWMLTSSRGTTYMNRVVFPMDFATSWTYYIFASQLLRSHAIELAYPQTFATIKAYLDRLVRPAHDGAALEIIVANMLGLTTHEHTLHPLDEETPSLVKEVGFMSKDTDQAIKDLGLEMFRGRLARSRDTVAKSAAVKSAALFKDKVIMPYILSEMRKQLMISLQRFSDRSMINQLCEHYPVLVAIMCVIGKHHKKVPSIFASWKLNAIEGQPLFLRWIPASSLLYKLVCDSKAGANLSTALIAIASRQATEDYQRHFKGMAPEKIVEKYGVMYLGSKKNVTELLNQGYKTSPTPTSHFTGKPTDRDRDTERKKIEEQKSGAAEQPSVTITQNPIRVAETDMHKFFRLEEANHILAGNFTALVMSPAGRNTARLLTALNHTQLFVAFANTVKQGHTQLANTHLINLVNNIQDRVETGPRAAPPPSPVTTPPHTVSRRDLTDGQATEPDEDKILRLMSSLMTGNKGNPLSPDHSNSPWFGTITRLHALAEKISAAAKADAMDKKLSFAPVSARSPQRRQRPGAGTAAAAPASSPSSPAFLSQHRTHSDRRVTTVIAPLPPVQPTPQRPRRGGGPGSSVL